MNLKIIYQLSKERFSFDKDKNKFKQNLWQKLESKMTDLYSVKLFWYQTRRFRYSLAVGVASLAIVLSGTGAYAYTSPDVIEGNVLYPVKKTIEKIEGATKITPQAKAKFYLKQIQRRETEIKQLNKNKNNKKFGNFVTSSISIINMEDFATSTIASSTKSFQKENFKKNEDLSENKLETNIKDIETELENLKNNSGQEIAKDSKLNQAVKDRLEKRLEKRKENLDQKLNDLKNDD